jgi:hypothetical protein
MSLKKHNSKIRDKLKCLEAVVLYRAFIVLYFFFFCAQLSYANTSFDTIYSKPNDQRICDIIEFPDFYILSGETVENGYWSSYVIKMNKNGDILKDTFFTQNSIAHKIYKTGNDFVLIRSIVMASMNYAYMSFTKMDTSLNIIYEKQLFLPDSVYLSHYNGIENSVGNLILAGTTNSFPGIPYDFDPFIYRVSATGDSLGSLFIKNKKSNIDGCEGVSAKDNMYFLFVNAFGQGSMGYFLVIDSSLTIIDTVGLQNNFQHKYSPKLIQDSVFVICTTDHDFEKVFISKINEAGQIIKSEIFGKSNTVTFPSYQNSLSIRDDKIFFLAISDFCTISPFLGYGKPSSLLVGKLDYNLNTQWLQYFGGDKYYHSFNISATSDGGCICIGTVNDTINHNNTRDIFVIKLDSNGVSNWQQTIAVPRQRVRVYPNPSNEKIFIEIGEFGIKSPWVEIFNSRGERVFYSEYQYIKQGIDVSDWGSGTYIGRIIMGTNASEMFKFVVY